MRPKRETPPLLGSDGACKGGGPVGGVDLPLKTGRSVVGGSERPESFS